MNSTKELSLTCTLPLLAPGVDMPILGFGTYQVQASECVSVCLSALQAGYRHIDSAQLYNNETEMGQAVRLSGIPRSEVFLTTKIRRPASNETNTYKKITDSVRKISGAEKGAAEDGFVDLFLVHTPYGGANAQRARKEMWLALERAFEEGKARAIGVSNYQVEHLEEMRGYAKVWPPHVNQIFLNPWHQKRDVNVYCKEHGIVIQAFSPLARGGRWDEPILCELAGKHGKSAAQILIRHALQKGWVPLPKSGKNDRIRANTVVFDYELDDGDMKALDELDGKTQEYFDSTLNRQWF
ncbi:unnamed protein product [Discula destructiva]